MYTAGTRQQSKTAFSFLSFFCHLPLPQQWWWAPSSKFFSVWGYSQQQQQQPTVVHRSLPAITVNYPSRSIFCPSTLPLPPSHWFTLPPITVNYLDQFCWKTAQVKPLSFFLFLAVDCLLLMMLMWISLMLLLLQLPLPLPLPSTDTFFSV